MRPRKIKILGSKLLFGIGLTTLSAAVFAQTADCDYVVSNEWNNGLIGHIRITNNSDSVIDGWSLGWEYQHNRITNLWNANLSGDNPHTASDMGWNSQIQPGARVEFGFQVDKNGHEAETPAVTGGVCDAAPGSSSSSAISSSSVPSSSSSLATSSSIASSSIGQSSSISQSSSIGQSSSAGHSSSVSSSDASSSSSSVPPVAEIVCDQQTTSDAQAGDVALLPVASCIVVDQFGYQPRGKKVAVLRDPQEGFDSDLEFTPGNEYALVNTATGQEVFTSNPAAWKNGDTSEISGDRVWWFDFSDVTEPGTYAVWDKTHNIRSAEFSIAADIFKPVLVDAVRSFFYQRAGFAKQAPYADPAWIDGASHLGSGQDPEARLYGSEDDPDTERDLRGGWYDAGDYNKYTNWHADYLVTLLHAYIENPDVWTDDFNIPESGNNIPDLLDELKWGMDWLVRMQEENGSVLSVVGLSHASPPSSATGPSVYGPATTSATLTSAQAFALGSKVFADVAGWEIYANDLAARAEQAWSWADANPSVVFENTGKVAAGEQEVDDEARQTKKRAAAVYLFALTGATEYRDHVDASYQEHNPVSWVGPWNERDLTTMLYYASLDGATGAIATEIEQNYQGAVDWSVIDNKDGPYRAYLSSNDFTWGSNRTIALKALNYQNLLSFGLEQDNGQAIRDAASGYLHYLHGTNPLGKVYLTNMYHLGVYDSVDTFYHTWFHDGSPHWDSVQESNYGPAPGFLVGGANPAYSWDACCPDSCGSPENNALCGAAPLSPPAGQPPQKSYLDFNTSWPLNSWAVTENHNDYQVAYIRLLSKFAGE